MPLTFLPSPDCDIILQANWHHILPRAREVNWADAATMLPLQDGEGLLGGCVPHMDTGRVADLPRGYDVFELRVLVYSQADNVVGVLQVEWLRACKYGVNNI